jgi:F0F1-type ATP synthase membrane subunit a
MLLGLMSIEGADLTWGTLALTSPLAILPFGLLVALTGLEVFVALLQAYIFTILTLVYLNDALHGH